MPAGSWEGLCTWARSSRRRGSGVRLPECSSDHYRSHRRGRGYDAVVRSHGESEPLCERPYAPVISPAAKVPGRIDYHRTAAPQRGSDRGSWVGRWLFRFFSLLTLGAGFLSISRVWTDRVAATMARQPGLSPAAGI